MWCGRGGLAWGGCFRLVLPIFYFRFSFSGFLLPFLQEVVNGARIHVAHISKLAARLAVDDLTAGLENGEGGNTLFEIDAVLLADVEVLVDVAADVYVDQDEVLVEDGEVFGLVEVEVQDLAVAAPVAAEVEDDAFVLAACGFEGGGDVLAGAGDVGEDVGVRQRLLGGGDGGKRRGEDRGEGENEGEREGKGTAGVVADGA
jgi:hypothetical protein